MVVDESCDISLRITDILVDGKSLSQIPEEQRSKITAFTPDFTEEITLPAAYHNFTIRFASLTYNMPRQNKYAYRLQNFDTDWHYVDADSRNAYYSNLPPGTYNFELRATNENGDWSEIRKMRIFIKPPFWATWWAYCIYLLLFIAIITIVLREIRRWLLLRNQLHLQEIETNKIQELNHIKL